MSPVAELLGPTGPLSRLLSGYELREGQLQMAQAVERAIATGATLICEAGTGTGKTLAYLVPAIVSGQKTVVSTATKALQDQIFSQDIPTIERYLGLRPRVALAKGLGNYLCRRRFDELQRSADHGTVAKFVARLERWVRTTETGDVAELDWLPENDPLWNLVASSTETRLGGKCTHYRDCFVTRMRREADEAQIVVANHHLVFADLALRQGSQERGGVLPEHQVLIFDEAHQIEDIASDFFGVRVSTARLESLLREADRLFKAAGLADTLLGGGHTATLTSRARQASRDFFDTLVLTSAGARTSSAEPGKKPLAKGGWSTEATEAYHRLDASLEALEATAERAARQEEIQALARRARQLRDDLAKVVDEKSRAVTWVESRQRSAAIGSTPIEVATILRSQVFERIPTVILTSATLTSARGFEFFRSRVGADSDHVLTHELSVPSPFDYETTTLLYTPSDLPEPSDPTFTDLSAGRAAQLIEITGGGALVLCTSNRAMGIMRERLDQALTQAVMMQGDAPKSSLLERFKSQHDSVLVATMSFWEGVDIPGDALRLVIIDKIPFAVPTDPVVMARCEALEQAGENPFVHYQVPLAAITLKQGFGRLIRTRRDRGIVAVLDRRLVQRGYGKSMLKGLPAARRVQDIREVEQLWRAMRPDQEAV